jgi:hypothetical protein
VIKASRTAEAAIGAQPVAKYRLQFTEEHAARLDAILRETKMAPSDWFARVLTEELERLGVPAPPPEADEPKADPRQTAFGFEAERPL